MAVFQSPKRERGVATKLGEHGRRSNPSLALWAAGLLTLALSHLAAATALGQTHPQAIIREDTVWSGRIEISSDVSITDGATVRAEPGTVIQFTKNGRFGNGLVISLRTVLTVSGDSPRSTRLILNGTADRPITFETVDGVAPGIIDGGPGTASTITARHVLFRRLGWPISERTCKPAISVQLVAADNDLWLSHCRFESCGPVRAEFLGTDSSAEVADCTFAGSVGPMALVFLGPGGGVKVVQNNIADAAFETACPQVLVRNNVLIGKTAALVIRNRLATAVTLLGNYVHCTERDDIGRYAARCEPVTTRLVDNVLVGGSYVLETAPQTVRRNVIIGAGNLRAAFGLTAAAKDADKLSTTTHALVTNICPNAVVTDNLLLGPAYATVDVGNASTAIRIEHNVLDGWGTARRALRFDITARDGLRVEFNDNLVAGYLQPPIINEARPRTATLHAANNTFVALAGPAYRNGDAASFDGGPTRDLAPGDRRADSFSTLGLARATAHSPATQSAADVDDLLASRRKTVAEVHKAWFEIYRPTHP